MTHQPSINTEFVIAAPKAAGNEAVLPEWRYLADKGYNAAGLCGPDAAAQNIIRIYLGLEPLAVEVRYDDKAPIPAMEFHASLPDSYDITRVKREDTKALDKETQTTQWANITNSVDFAERTLHHIQTAYKSEETAGIDLEFVQNALKHANAWLKTPAIDIVFEHVATGARALVTRYDMQVEGGHLVTAEVTRLERKPRLLAPAA